MTAWQPASVPLTKGQKPQSLSLPRLAVRKEEMTNGRKSGNGDDSGDALDVLGRAHDLWKADPRFHAEPEDVTPSEARTASPQRRLLTAQEVADYLAVKPSWVLQEARAGRLPVVRVGRYRRFRLAAIEAWAAARERDQS
jgi:excisionase family DNA binding protein